MIDLNKIINDSLTKIEAEGYVQQVVESKVKETLKSVINDCLNSWSDFGKNLKEEIKANLKINLNQLDIAEYNVLVLNAVKEKLDEVVTVQGIEKIKEGMDKMLTNIKPEYTLSEIIEAIKDEERDYRNSEDSITLFIEESYSIIRIYLNDQEESHKHNCKYNIWIHEKDKTACRVQVSDRRFDKNSELRALFGVEKLLFKIYATGAKVVLDQGVNPDNYNLNY